MKDRALLLLALAGLLCAIPLRAASPEVEALLTFIGTSDCDFTRNGITHSATEAEAHLRRKYAYAEDQIDSAEAFIDRLATRSSISRQPYTVTCAGGPSRASADWLHEQLRTLRAQR